MEKSSQQLDSADPLHGHSFLSAVLRIIRASPDAPKLAGNNGSESDHDFMKQMNLRSPEKHLEKAKSILNADTVAAISTKKPQERRPGLGIKRAPFALKPDSSQPVVEPKLDVTKYRDPVELFAAYDRIENVKKEIRRQRGASVSNLNEPNPSMNVRRRRPGILGNSAAYKKHDWSMLSVKNDNIISSQGSLEQNTPYSPGRDQHQEVTNSENEEEIELAGSIAKSETRVNEILDELLSTNDEDLDEDGVVSLLQERLQIKPIDLGKLSLPEFPNIERTNFMALREKLPKPRDSLLDMRNLMKGMSGKLAKQQKQAPESPFASPTPPKSPFAAISMLKKRIQQSNPLRDPFTPLNVDLSAAGNSSVGYIDKQANEIGTPKKLSISRKSNSAKGGEISKIAAASTGSSKIRAICSTLSPEKSVSDRSDQQTVGVDARPTGFLGNLEDGHMSNNLNDENLECGVKGANADDADWRNGVDARPTGFHSDLEYGHMSSNLNDKNLECSVKSANADDADWRNGVDARPTGFHSDLDDGHMSSNLNDENLECGVKSANASDADRRNGHGEMEHNVEDRPQQGVTSPKVSVDNKDSTISYTDTDVHTHGSILMEVENLLQEEAPGGQSNIHTENSIENLSNNESQLERTNVANEEHDIEVPLTSSGNDPEQFNENRPMKSSNKPRKGKRPFSHRQSLAEAGTWMEGGVRRSKRIRTRPLEYWKGERFLYGRLHQSLPTVIGLKYMSPAKDDGKLAFKVKSYVSDEHKELVELQALH